ncbi:MULTISPECIES: CoA ester lyase [unclassified Polaromonas]|jgi:citrate lyase subunit beta/citryl-CoA lyase|uniref:HpcH/HpaI aldolase/citrate lyase family protein n=1 Tax=unclassified Polaromonas TaxID=2638319 RepID=UPI000BD344AD|nr:MULTISPECIES: CoA ester lyase [unclassified Polaromonas]OYY31784.1 MAG: CoA ester lyase [Polaromonas sp. 35-63-35]OYZ20266.1 MAG: CoA ester lyase [Polaromonas sp. 16-63-31]OYZ78956.1 MAG: CoA ester lyase [Polaromonas sp. 24-63-21]OZA49529.1 MAG: CoA ester lyase [Polaromonas sp. 17-63-33]OZA84991.1 MAG: CoA ester lyase [Polaromonas sp. 39-63-25]
MSESAGQPLALARSFLFVPATRPERFAKALASGADAVIIDLEDAVAPGDKAQARQGLAQAWAGLAMAERARVLVRVNAGNTAWHGDDLNLLVGLGVAGVVLPKAEHAAQLSHVAAVLGSACVLVPLIESVAGLDAADTLARCPQVLRLAFGNLDFQADAGLACGPDEAELTAVRLAVLLASRRAQLPSPIDGVTADTQDAAQLARDLLRSRSGGFGAKLCIHPAQVAAVNAAFTPSPAEIDWARRVLAASEAAGGAVVSLDGRMVDAPVLLLAQRTLARAADVSHGHGGPDRA